MKTQGLSQKELLDLDEQCTRQARELKEQQEQVRAHLRPPGAQLAPMVGPAGAAQVWKPPGVRILHIYGLMRPTTALADLETATRDLTGNLMAPVPRQWQHWTWARIEDATTAEAKTIATTLAAHLNDHPAPQATGARRWEFAAQAALHRHGILITPAGAAPPVTTLMQAAAAAMRSVDPDAQRTRTPRHAHSSLSYNTPAVRELSHREVADLSDRFGVRDVDIELEAVAVVWAKQHPAGPQYTWDVDTFIPLS